MVVQGSNSPLTIEFDGDVTEMESLVATLWRSNGQEVKRWEKEDMDIVGAVATLPLKEGDTASFPAVQMTLEIKGLDASGGVVLWDQLPLRVVRRNDRVVVLTEGRDELESREDT